MLHFTQRVLLTGTALVALSVSAYAADKKAPAAPVAPAPAAAAAPVAPKLPDPPVYGAAIPGQCYVDLDSVVWDSQIGRDGLMRLQQIKSQIDALDDKDADSFKATVETLKADAAKATTAVQKQSIQSRVQALQEKEQQLQQQAQLRDASLNKIHENLGQYLYSMSIPQITAANNEKGCSALMNLSNVVQYNVPDGNGSKPVLFVNPSMNITRDVIAKVDATGNKLPPINWQDPQMPQQQAQAQGAAPAKK